MAYGSQHSFWMVPEVTYGTTPTTPAFVSIPVSKFTGGISMTTLIDDTIRGDRQIVDARGGAITSKFDITTKLRYSAYDSLLAAVLCGAWTQVGSSTTYQLLTGVTYQSFTGERHFADLTDKPYYRQPGTELSKMSLKCTKDALIDATFSCVSQTEIDDTAAITGATYGTIPTAVGPFDSFTGSISEGGSSIGIVQDFSLDIDNNLELKPVVGSRLTLRPAKLLSNVSGTLQVYFETDTLWDKFKASSYSSLALTLTDPLNNQLVIAIPRIMYTGEANRDVTGPGAVSMSLKFQGLLDSGTGTNISFTRTPHS